MANHDSADTTEAARDEGAELRQARRCCHLSIGLDLGLEFFLAFWNVGDLAGDSGRKSGMQLFVDRRAGGAGLRRCRGHRDGLRMLTAKLQTTNRTSRPYFPLAWPSEVARRDTLADDSR